MEYLRHLQDAGVAAEFAADESHGFDGIDPAVLDLINFSPELEPATVDRSTHPSQASNAAGNTMVNHAPDVAQTYGTQTTPCASGQNQPSGTALHDFGMMGSDTNTRVNNTPQTSGNNPRPSSMVQAFERAAGASNAVRAYKTVTRDFKFDFKPASQATDTRATGTSNKAQPAVIPHETTGVSPASETEQNGNKKPAFSTTSMAQDATIGREPKSANTSGTTENANSDNSTFINAPAAPAQSNLNPGAIPHRPSVHGPIVLDLGISPPYLEDAKDFAGFSVKFYSYARFKGVHTAFCQTDALSPYDEAAGALLWNSLSNDIVSCLLDAGAS